MKQVLRSLFSFPALLGVLLVGAAFLFARTNIPGQESMLHAKIGKDLLATPGWPTTDAYSFIAHGNDAIAFEWLSDLLLATMDRLKGVAGLMLLLLALVGIATLLLYYLVYQRSGNAKASFAVCVLVLPLLSPFLYLRAQLIGIVFLLLTLVCLESFRQGRSKPLWLLPGLFLVWVNVHATFVFGFFVLGLYWASGLWDFRLAGLRAEAWTARERLQLLAVALLSVIAVMVTPYGTRLAAMPLEVLNAPLAVSVIDEYLPLSAFPLLLKLFLALLLPFLVAVLVLRPSYRAEELTLLLFAAYAGCLHLRFLWLFVVAFAPMLATLIAGWFPAYAAGRDHPFLNTVLMLLIVAAMAKTSMSRQELDRAVAGAYPERAFEYLQEHPVTGPVFNEDSWGDYLIWKSDGKHKVFIDTRSLIYENAGVFADYVDIMRVRANTGALLQKYGFEACLVDRSHPLVAFLTASPQWKKVYEDDLSVIVRRQHLPVVSAAISGQ